MTPRRFRIACLSLLFLVVYFGVPLCAASDTQNSRQPLTLTVDAAAEPVPALRYRLLPIAPELKRGNALPIYLRLTKEEGSSFFEHASKTSDWLDRPLDELSLPEMDKYLGTFSQKFEQLRFGSIRERCEWEYPIGEEPYWETLLPDVNEIRVFGRLLALKARFEIKQGRFDDALRTLRTGFALSRHVNEGPFLVHDLVAMSIAGSMLDRIEELIIQPEAPNLYWALTSLPHPFIDLRRAVEFELGALELTIPELAHLERQRTPEQWTAILRRASRMAEFAGDRARDSGKWQVRLSRYAKALASGKRHLIEEDGRTPEEVEAMSLSQVIVLHMMSDYAELRDELYKWFSLPFHEAAPRLDLVSDKIERLDTKYGFPFLTSVLSGPSGFYTTTSRIERSLAALRAVEGLRMYAAEHGRLPRQLADVSQVPIPDDPMLGKPFFYELGDDVAVLETSPLDGRRFEWCGVKYRVQLRR